MPDLLRTQLTFPGDTGPVQAYLSRPQVDGPVPAVIVIHEIFGLVPHTMDVADRFAAQGYAALAPNLFSRPGLAEILTPEAIEEAMGLRSQLPSMTAQSTDVQAAEHAESLRRVSALLFGGGLPRESLLLDLARAVDYLAAQPYVQPGKIASLGFCFGGGMSIALACQAPLAACVDFYGANPSPIELVEHIPCPVLGLYGAEDQRINSSLDSLVKAMTEYKKDFEMRIYPGAAHAFFNDTRPQVYRPGPAAEAWERVLRFFERTLRN